MRVVTRCALVCGALALAGCGGSSTSSPAAAPAAAASTGTSAPPAAAGSALKIAGFAYAPSPLTVAPGQVVAVTNSDSTEHTVTSDVKDLFLADDVARGKVISFKAPDKPGTYTFHCQYHASMHGTLVVTGG